ncbi:hypothetical protein Patl1_21750 [Pistacia atlantica]|uniref:Uncharacterized protein n=1 Tax=Pistacia atlantica TaxID=434234 RepID=A0ACC1BMK8_9ROSI|nr:hypothetical protein Patl1_21750 [Pistacia atlantica]
MAPSSNTVKIQEVSLVTPSSNPNSEFSLPLTLYDTFWFNFPPVERLYFYQITADLTPHFFNSVILPKLKHSLSLTLRHYLPLSGNLIWPPEVRQPYIYYSPNDGVTVTVAESTADFNSLSGNGVHEVVDLHPLIPQLLTSDDKAAMIAIQITLFPSQGFSIGITTHHAIFDGKSSTTFIKSRAYLCKQDPTGIDMEYVNNWHAYINTRSLKVLPNIAPNADWFEPHLS